MEKVAWARDFCFLQHGCTTTDPDTGERLFAVVAGSIERPEVPDMENLCKRIRSKVKTSGVIQLFACRVAKDQPTDRPTSVVVIGAAWLKEIDFYLMECVFGRRKEGGGTRGVGGTRGGVF